MPDLRRDGIGRGEAGARAPLGDTIRLPNARCRSTRSRRGRLGESGPAPYRKPHPIPARPLTLDPRLARIPRLPRIAAPSINAGLEFRVAHESPRARSTRSSNSESRATRISGARGSTLGFPARVYRRPRRRPSKHAALVRAFDPRLAGIPRLPRTAARSINARLEFRVAGDADFQPRVDRRRGSATRAVAPRPSRAPGATSTLSPAGRGGRSTARGRGRRR